MSVFMAFIKECVLYVSEQSSLGLLKKGRESEAQNSGKKQCRNSYVRAQRWFNHRTKEGVFL